MLAQCVSFLLEQGYATHLVHGRKLRFFIVFVIGSNA